VKRNRRGTEDKLIRAVGTILERDGFEQVGINEIARTAGVDKVLIYRYFGGLDGLLERFGESADIWWTVDEILGESESHRIDDNLPALCKKALTRQVEALRTRPIAQQILLWELCQSNGLTRKLNELRDTRMQQLVRRVIELGGRRADTRLLAVHGLLSAAAEYFVLRARTSEQLLGMDFSTDSGWNRLSASLSAVVQSVFAED
jgi:AcrR family transcriptional regulator